MFKDDDFSNIKLPHYSSASNNSVDIICDIRGVGSGVLFTASKTDSTLYGRSLYDRAVAGEFGDVVEYAAPIIIESGE
ncbi:hypothetical protein RCN67_11680 [Escherichia marmotae]|uniref:hypothetical protein n=1 Tax=Escherichia marmotae TaxID=1499973 RepID=UPI0015F13EB6|nr:hypothetical protein [Escherichia marmotae]MEC9671549.1 hypothetical protein [Escherichia marmotae]MED0604374.1 hypothetical protein [Escherichia marmotae]MED9364375.1 hypothetical protein [Escherichia marmotae]MED9496352.1 hypothetical protein [Escherichia marmotae]MED9524107.1 hypothetical protein [Escherichia marmotae]